MIDINSPISIRGLTLKNRLFLAPVNGVFDTPYRMITLPFGPGLTFSEMMNARSISGKHVIEKSMLMRGEGEKPFAMQISEHDPELLTWSARIIEEEHLAEWVDLNSGCPSRTVINSGNGAALMKDPKLFASLVAAIRESTSLPFSVKIRAGWDDSNRNAVEIARIAQEEGADLVTVHGRTRAQMYHGDSDRGIIAEVKAALSIPVIGNGDVFSWADARRMLEETGCDGVMVARGAYGNPWLLSRILRNDDMLQPTPDERMKIILLHVEYLCRYGDKKHSIRRMRKHIPWYIKGLPNATAFRSQLNSIDDRMEMETAVRNYFKYISTNN